MISLRGAVSIDTGKKVAGGPFSSRYSRRQLDSKRELQCSFISLKCNSDYFLPAREKKGGGEKRINSLVIACTGETSHAKITRERERDVRDKGADESPLSHPDGFFFPSPFRPQLTKVRASSPRGWEPRGASGRG